MSYLSLEDVLDLEALGRAARASGRGLLTNPYFKPEALPEQTGEDVSTWELKAKAWVYGWKSPPAMAPNRHDRHGGDSPILR